MKDKTGHFSLSVICDKYFFWKVNDFLETVFLEYDLQKCGYKLQHQCLVELQHIRKLLFIVPFLKREIVKNVAEKQYPYTSTDDNVKPKVCKLINFTATISTKQEKLKCSTFPQLFLKTCMIIPSIPSNQSRTNLFNN